MPHPTAFSRTVFAALLSLTLALTGCDGPAPEPTGGPTSTGPTVVARPGDRDRLVALATLARERRYVAYYDLTDDSTDPTPTDPTTDPSADPELTGASQPSRTVTAAFGLDGSWVVNVPGGALGGQVDIAIFFTGTTLHQCATSGAAPHCVVVGTLAAAHDPRVQHVFTDWIARFMDRASALSVAGATVAGVSGTCFAVESTTIGLAPVVDPGIYCYADDGILTYAQTGFGTLRLTGAVGPAPSTVTVPVPVIDADPLPV